MSSSPIRSAATLRGCVDPLAAMPNVRVTVVDNASPDDSVATSRTSTVDIVRSPRNGGFAYGCNLGRRPRLRAVPALPQPGRADRRRLARGARVASLRGRRGVGLVAPRILDDDGSLAYSLRRFPRLRSTFAQALFLHRAWPLRDVDRRARPRSGAYERAGHPEWVSGACMLVRRAAYEAIGGFDEGFFLYCEDTDLCLRLWRAGHGVRFVPAALVHHVGGASSGAGETQPIAARSRVYYARKHRGRVAARHGGARRCARRGDPCAGRRARARPSRRGHMAALRAVVTPAR